MFDEILPAYHTQQQTLQLQSIAHQHSMPTFPPSTPVRHSADLVTPSGTPATPVLSIPPGRRPSGPPSATPIEPPTPASQNEESSGSGNTPFLFPRVDPAEKRPRVEEASSEGPSSTQEPQKKKRRVALTRVGDLDS
jgi:chromatin assembly factor 1 subunit B